MTYEEIITLILFYNLTSMSSEKRFTTILITFKNIIF